jgi:TFIIF-interacting CTD phosphatase-like protein
VVRIAVEHLCIDSHHKRNTPDKDKDKPDKELHKDKPDKEPDKEPDKGRDKLLLEILMMQSPPQKMLLEPELHTHLRLRRLNTLLDYNKRSKVLPQRYLRQQK